MTHAKAPRPPSVRPIGTYSIVARDDDGSLGVAVQSHWFNVGAVVPSIEPGVGAVAVQSITDPSTGELVLAELRRGRDAGEALSSVLQGQGDLSYRQVAAVGMEGDAAAHTGDLCIAEAGHTVTGSVSAQANIMERPTVWPAMVAAYERADGDLADRLLAALDGGQREGGDIRGCQSAALLVSTGDHGSDFDLRVEDSSDPLGELRRLVSLRRAYIELNRGDALMADGSFGEALDAYQTATTVIPDGATHGEAAFWTGVAFAAAGRPDDARPFLERAARMQPSWELLLPRLVRSKMLPDDDALIDRLRSMMGTDPGRD
jgi:uncharacterized Ntn-hydrolase superfamily protein